MVFRYYFPFLRCLLHAPSGFVPARTGFGIGLVVGSHSVGGLLGGIFHTCLQQRHQQQRQQEIRGLALGFHIGLDPV